MRAVALIPLFLAPGIAVAPQMVQAASFDCTAASSPFEHAICDSSFLSVSDERLARAYELAVAGLSKKAQEAVRADQRAWLTYVNYACTQDGEPMTEGRYDEQGTYCLNTLLRSRASMLERGHIEQGNRFYSLASYAAIPDPNEAGNPESSWPLAQHSIEIIQMDVAANDLPAGTAAKFNAFVRGLAGSDEDLLKGDISGLDNTSDNDTIIRVEDIGSTGRISLAIEGYWYGHGAAHGQPSTYYVHYMPGDDRKLGAEDIFDKSGWGEGLTELAIIALEQQHGENLFDLDVETLRDTITNPQSWSFANPYGLTIQFQPYEVAAYAYGSPTVFINWELLAPYTSENSYYYR